MEKHTRETSGIKLLQLALCEGRLVSVFNVANGKECNCVCPSCGNPLMAKNKGKIKVAHFAHLINKDCPSAIESAIHLLSKEIFLKTRKLFIPDYKFYYHRFKKEIIVLKYNSVLKFDSVELEKRILVGNEFIIADAVGYIGEKQLIVEFANTHFIDEDKHKKLKKLGLPCIEFSVCLGSQDRKTLSGQLLTDDLQPAWIVNQKGKELAKLELEKLKIQKAREDLRLRVAAEERIQKRAEIERDFLIRQRDRRIKVDQQRSADLKEAGKKGNLITECPIQKDLYKLYSDWITTSHPVIEKLRRAIHISDVYDRLPHFVDIFINKQREIIIPENFKELAEAEKNQCLRKWDFIQLYLEFRKIKHIRFCGICKFYHGKIYEFTICSYSSESSLEHVFNKHDQLKSMDSEFKQ